MSRHRFAREGVETLGRFIDPGAIKWDEGEEFPVIWQFQFDDPKQVLGSAMDLQREDDGWITVEIVWNDRYREVMEAEIDKTLYLTVYANQLTRSVGSPDWVSNKKLDHITSCRLRSINAVVGNPWVEDATMGDWQPID